LFSRQPTNDVRLFGELYPTKFRDKPSQAAWDSYLRILLRTNEFVYVD